MKTKLVMRRLALLTIITAGLFACSSTPEFNAQNAQLDLTPQAAVRDKTASKGARIFWGGTIIQTRNLETATHIEVLAYPLDDEGWPDVGAEPGGRFIIERSGYMEPAKYATGRQLTTVGTIITMLKGRVGESDYLFPVVKPEQMHLWSRDYLHTKPRVHFGIGIGISR